MNQFPLQTGYFSWLPQLFCTPIWVLHYLSLDFTLAEANMMRNTISPLFLQ